MNGVGCCPQPRESLSVLPLRSFTSSNCEVPEEEKSEELEMALSRYSSDTKPALEFMKNYKRMDFKSFVKDPEEHLEGNLTALALPIKHRRTESLNSQDKTRLHSHSGLGISPNPSKITDATATKLKKFEFDSIEKSMEVVDLYNEDSRYLDPDPKIKKEIADISYLKSTKVIKMTEVPDPPVRPGPVFNKQKAMASLAKAAYLVTAVYRVRHRHAQTPHRRSRPI